jgi:hypothetical protein
LNNTMANLLGSGKLIDKRGRINAWVN